MKKQNEKIRPVEALSQGRWHYLSSWLRNSLYGLLLALYGAVMIASCKTIQYVPVGTTAETTTNIIDSVRIRDSVRIIEKSRYKDWAGLLDTLRIRGARSQVVAWNDTTKSVLAAELTEDRIEEHNTNTEHYTAKADTIKIEKEIPVPVPIKEEVEVIPRFYRIFTILGIIESLILMFVLYLNLKKTGFFKKLISIFKKRF